jgi:heavy metal sensor kinase
MRSLRPKNLRARLTLWYMAVLATLLTLGWAASSVLVYLQLKDQLVRFSVEEIETVEGLLFLTPDGRVRLRDDYHNHSESKEVIDNFVEVRSAEGTVLFRNVKLRGRALGGLPFDGEGVGGYSPRSVRLSNGEHVSLVSRSHILDGHRILIRLGHSEEPMLARIKDLFLAWLITLPAVLLAAGFAGYALARRALSPLDRMTERARQLTAERLSERLPNQDVDDELGRLARVFNETFARLEKAFNQLRSFTSDCSHELRTPLAIIRSVGEVGIENNTTCDDYRDTVGSMLEEADRLRSLVDGLLMISRAETGGLELRRAAVPMMATVREVVRLLGVLLEEKSLTAILEGDENADVDVDKLLLRQALINVIHNAVKYSPFGAAVCVRIMNGNAGQVTVEVQDRGPGIPFEDRDRVFERFYRVDKSRARESGGAGLGLSIAKWAIEAQGGTIGLDSTPGEGCTFRISLPGLRR